MAAVWIKIDHTGAWFNRTWCESLVDHAQANGAVSIFERGLDISAARLGEKSDVCTKLLVEQGSASVHCLLRVGNRLHRFVIYLDHVASVQGGIEILGKHYRHGVTYVARTAYRQRSPFRLFHTRHRKRIHGRHTAHQFRACKGRHDAWMCPGRVQLDFLNDGMSIRTAYDNHVQRHWPARGLQIVYITGMPCNQSIIFSTTLKAS